LKREVSSRTKPIGFAGAGKTIPKTPGLQAATRHGSQACETKPIPAAEAARRKKSGGDAQPSIRSRAGSTKSRPRDSLCETKPIHRERRAGQVLCGRRVTTHWACKGLRRNKANLEVPAGSRADHAKQTQFREIGRADPGDRLYKQTQFRRACPPERDSAKQSQLPAGQDTPLFHYSIIPVFQARAICFFGAEDGRRG
jgi:hypothetical protein